MDDQEVWTALMAFIAGLIIPVVLEIPLVSIASSAVKALVSYIICILIAVGIAFVRGTFDAGDIVLSIGVCLITAQVLVLSFIKPVVRPMTYTIVAGSRRSDHP